MRIMHFLVYRARYLASGGATASFYMHKSSKIKTFTCRVLQAPEKPVTAGDTRVMTKDFSSFGTLRAKEHFKGIGRCFPMRDFNETSDPSDSYSPKPRLPTLARTERAKFNAILANSPPAGWWLWVKVPWRNVGSCLWSKWPAAARSFFLPAQQNRPKKRCIYIYRYLSLSCRKVFEQTTYIYI